MFFVYRNSIRWFFWKITMRIALCCLFTLTTVVVSGTTLAKSNETDWSKIEELSQHSTKVLSRRKRFLIFPEGSSFQLVFCTQTHGYLQVGDIVWFGNTAALAWELPSDPATFGIFKDSLRHYDGNRRSDNKHIYYLDENGRVIGKVAYHRKPIVNPAFAKRSVDQIAHTKTLSKKKMHDMQKNANYLTSLHEKSIEFHRAGRKSLYAKVEKVLQALGWNGERCVLRMLCESKKQKEKQGMFLEEIFKATFTLPKGKEFEDHHKLYDTAHGSNGDCATLYPGCEDLHGIPLHNSK